MLSAAEARSLVLRYNEHLANPIDLSAKYKALNDITQRIGSLSAPSKMPGHGWSISPNLCKTGSKLAKIEGTPCSKCYAMKGRYRFSNVEAAHTKRYMGWLNDVDWVGLSAIRLILLKEEYMRWFDAGDLQSIEMLQDINDVAMLTPHIKHWLPTQERRIVHEFQSRLAPNLNVRISSSKLGETQLSKQGINTSSVAKEGFTCPASLQGNVCGSCRACWDKEVQHVIYHQH